MLKPGDSSPAFRLKTDDGSEISLADLKGQRAILFLFPKANTTG
jgi:thioredoxin-dependent peroxiredoxin